MTEQEAEVELVTFSTSKEAYVYAPLPAAISYGHRAELWNPDKWLKEVKIKVVTAGNHCYVRMLDNENGELFAECPLPHDGTPLTTAVEPVIDSSRYFVIKLVDRESGNHAFVGIGFRERMDASDFSAALDDYRQYLRRKQEAEQMREQFSKQTVSTDGEAAQEGTAAATDLSLKPGQTIRINLSSSIKRSSSSKSDSSKASPAAAAGGSSSGGGGTASPQLKLAPPPGNGSGSSSSSGYFKLQPPPLARSVSGSATATVGVQEQSSSSSGSGVAPASKLSSPHVMRVSNTDAAAPVVAAGSREDDDWGEFVS